MDAIAGHSPLRATRRARADSMGSVLFMRATLVQLSGLTQDRPGTTVLATRVTVCHG